MKLIWSLVCVAASGVIFGCSGAEPDSGLAGGVSDAPVAETQTDDFTVALYARTKENLVRGNNRVEVEVSSERGAEMPDFEVELMTYMPAMGHGPSQQPKLVEIAESRYTFDNVVLNMPGLWELRVQFSGGVRDELVFEFDVE